MATTDPVLCVTEWNAPPPTWLAPGAPLPLLGSPHSDPDIPGSGIVHRHCDWRYVDPASFEAAAYPSTHGWVGGIYREDAIATTEVIHLPRLRPFPAWVFDGTYGGAFDWFYEIQDRFKDSRLDCDRCPHKGFDLSAVAPDEHGRRECPLHGLRWGADGDLDYRDKADVDLVAYFRYSYAEIARMKKELGLPYPSEWDGFQREISNSR